MPLALAFIDEAPDGRCVAFSRWRSIQVQSARDGDTRLWPLGKVAAIARGEQGQMMAPACAYMLAETALKETDLAEGFSAALRAGSCDREPPTFALMASAACRKIYSNPVYADFVALQDLVPGLKAKLPAKIRSANFPAELARSCHQKPAHGWICEVDCGSSAFCSPERLAGTGKTDTEVLHAPRKNGRKGLLEERGEIIANQVAQVNELGRAPPPCAGESVLRRHGLQSWCDDPKILGYMQGVLGWQSNGTRSGKDNNSEEVLEKYRNTYSEQARGFAAYNVSRASLGLSAESRARLGQSGQCARYGLAPGGGDSSKLLPDSRQPDLVEYLEALCEADPAADPLPFGDASALAYSDELARMSPGQDGYQDKLEFLAFQCVATSAYRTRSEWAAKFRGDAELFLNLSTFAVCIGLSGGAAAPACNQGAVALGWATSLGELAYSLHGLNQEASEVSRQLDLGLMEPSDAEARLGELESRARDAIVEATATVAILTVIGEVMGGAGSWAGPVAGRLIAKLGVKEGIRAFLKQYPSVAGLLSKVKLGEATLVPLVEKAILAMETQLSKVVGALSSAWKKASGGELPARIGEAAKGYFTRAARALGKGRSGGSPEILPGGSSEKMFAFTKGGSTGSRIGISRTLGSPADHARLGTVEIVQDLGDGATSVIRVPASAAEGGAAFRQAFANSPVRATLNPADLRPGATIRMVREGDRLVGRVETPLARAPAGPDVDPPLQNGPRILRNLGTRDEFRGVAAPELVSSRLNRPGARIAGASRGEFEFPLPFRRDGGGSATASQFRARRYEFSWSHSAEHSTPLSVIVPDGPSGEAAAAVVLEAVERLPAGARDHLRRVVVVDATFQGGLAYVPSSSTGIPGTIYLTREAISSPGYLKNSLLPHEFGHTLERRLAMSAGVSQEEFLRSWRRTMEQDRALGRAAHVSGQGDPHRTVMSSDRAATALKEDFANSFESFFRDPVGFARQYPNRARFLSGVR